jgi:hypothetical protein
MSKMTGDTSNWCRIETQHVALIEWWWTDRRLHDDDYKIKVQDTVDEVVQCAEDRFGVEEDKTLTCQWEGVLIRGACMEKVQEAARLIVRALRRFRDVRPLHTAEDTNP